MIKQSVVAALGFTAVIALSGLTGASKAHASEYTFAGFSVEDYDERGLDTGFKLEGSYELQDRYFVSGYYRNLDDDGFNNDDLDSLSVNVGRYFNLDHGFVADVSGRVGHVDYGFDNTNFYGVAANLRKRFGLIEVHGGASFIDYTSAGTDTQYTLGARAFIMPQFAVGLEVADTEFGDNYGITARYVF